MRTAVVVPLMLAIAGCAQKQVTIQDAWIRAAPPGADTMAAYLTVHNPTDQAIRITGVDSPWFRRAMIHRTEIHDGVARMVHEAGLDVPPGAHARLEPGGRHIMLVGPDRPVTAGIEVPVSLVLEDGRTLGVLAPVRAGG